MAIRALHFLLTGCFFLSLLALAGCSQGVSENPTLTMPSSAAALRPGDELLISLRSIPDPSDNSSQIDDRGFITLPFLGLVKAAGKTPSELTENIKNAYQRQDIYKQVDVSVSVTERYIYVGGEVSRPGRVLWTPDITLTKAIQSAGGFTLYAKENGLQLARDRRTYTLSATAAQKDPDQDPKLFPGDSINVPRSAF